MRFLRPKVATPPPRAPDPDPVVETRLQQLDELASQNSFKRTQMGQYQTEIQKLYDDMRALEHRAQSSYYRKGEAQRQGPVTERRIAQLQAEIRTLESDIQANLARATEVRRQIEQERFRDIRDFKAN